MATTKDYRLGEFTFPRGWFMIADAEELDTHRPLAVRFFGKDFALYRGRATGKVVLLDAYCPHMKTHLAAPNKTSYVIQDGMGTNVEGDGIRCPYHAWRFGPDGKCDDIPYHKGEIPAAACVKSWTVVESLGAVFVWHDPEGGEPEWDHPSLPQWDDPAWVRPKWDHLGMLKQHGQEIVDNICDYGHLSPIHGSTVERFENEIKGHMAIQRQCGGHRTLVSADGVSADLHTITTYHGPGVLMSDADRHVRRRDADLQHPGGRRHHQGLARPDGALAEQEQAKATKTDAVEAAHFQEMALTAFVQDIEVWNHKAPCINGLFIPSDGAFVKARIWYKQFYNPRAKKQEFLDQAEGVYVPRGIPPYTQPKIAA
jgi:3-ketosteroid 9alpha-monooxygenase subunit A